MKTDSKKRINVIAEKGATQITILEGVALPPKEKAFHQFNGTISAPSKYAEHRKIDPGKALVIIDDNGEESTISLICDQFGEINAAGQYTDVILGKIELHPELKALPINGSKNFQIDEFRTWVRQNSQLFATFDEHAALTSNLAKVKGIIITTMENQRDTAGNSKHSVEHVFNNELKKDFQLSVPLLRGQSKSAFKVDICLSVEGKGVVLWLESNDLKKKIGDGVAYLISEEKKYFEGKKFCVIYKTK